MDGLYNPYLVIPLTTWFVAQVSKFVHKAWRGEVNFKLLYNSGGMPSAHSAVVTSLAVAALIINGPASPLFGISVVLAAIVMYDSFGVRRSSGDQSKAINAIIESLEDKQTGGPAPIRLREIFGHKPSEVVAGALLGIAISLAMTTSVWAQHASFLVQPVSEAESYVYLAVFAAIILAGVVAHRLSSRKPYRHVDSSKNLRKVIFWVLQLPAWGGVLFVVLQMESVSVWHWRLWPLLIFAALAAVHGVLAATWYRYLPARLQKEGARVRRRRQAKKRRKRKKKRK